MHYFIHGKIYFIVDEIAIDSCETIYSTKEEAQSIQHSYNALYLYYHSLNLWYY